jgi:hypothetical protein
VEHDVIAPQVGWTARWEGRPAVVVRIDDRPVLVDGEVAQRIELLAAPIPNVPVPLIVECTTADVDVTPNARPAKVLGPVALWLATHRPKTPADKIHADEVTTAMLTVLGLPDRHAA